MDNKVQYCDYNSVLVVNATGQLRKVFTPFRVLAKNAKGDQKQVHIVDEVRTTMEDQLVYIINNIPYYHHNFTLEIDF
jgi:hypothetical protein